MAILKSAFDKEIFPIGEVRQHKGTPSEKVRDYPLYDLIPSDTIEQIQWRIGVRERAHRDISFRAGVINACRNDILFFINTFCWVFEPRPTPRVLPMNTWRDQDDVIAWMDECYGTREVGIEKSRGVGASWNAIALFFHKWLFVPRAAMAVISRTEEAADTRDDPDCLMWKLDFLYENLPYWLREDSEGRGILERNYGTHKFLNRANGASIYGYAATGDVTTGGRKTAVLLDEFAKFKVGQDQAALDSTQHVTDSRYFVSTYKGSANCFYTMMTQPSSMLKIIIDWKDNPDRGAGLYTSDKGELRLLDNEYKHAEDYDYILDGKTRSPWYDGECRRPGATPLSIAQELDRDPYGSVSKLFSKESYERQKPFVSEPTWRGEADWDTESLEIKWHVRADGPMRLWVPKDDLPNRGPYAVGWDVAAGTGGDFSSNSVLQILDISTGEQVGEYASNNIYPNDFAQLAVAICRFLAGTRDPYFAYLNWDANGSGGAQFFKEIKRWDWANLYMHRSTTNRRQERTKKPGYWQQDKGAAILMELHNAMLHRNIVIQSKIGLEECMQYEYDGEGAICHRGAAISEDPSAKGKSHGDRAYALAVALLAAQDRTITEDDPPPQMVPRESFAGLMARESQSSSGSVDNWWGEVGDGAGGRLDSLAF